jgi:hypothetical protein
MQLAAATTPITTPHTSATQPVAAATSTSSDRNPWGFPRLDGAVAQHALDGLRSAKRTVNHLIDRGIAVRVQLDHDLKAGVFSPDTVTAVELLTRARDYAIDTLQERDLPSTLQSQLRDWVRANPKDQRIGVVLEDISDLEHAVQDLLDDDEGNVRDEIAALRANPSRRTFQSVRDSLDGSIAALYDARDVSGATHVLRAAGELR